MLGKDIISLKEEGIILDTLVFQENDLILTIFLKNHGKIKAFAKGAKKSKKRFSSGLEFFDHGIFTLKPPKSGNFYLLLELEKKSIFLEFRNDFQKLLHASLCLESSKFALHEDPGTQQSSEIEEAFESLLETLRYINSADSSLSSKLSKSFLVYLLRTSGEVGRETTTLFEKAELPQVVKKFEEVFNVKLKSY